MAPEHNRAITTPTSHLSPFLATRNKLCERGEGGKRGGELAGAKKVGPIRWKVIFLAENGVREGARITDRLPPERLCGPGSD